MIWDPVLTSCIFKYTCVTLFRTVFVLFLVTLIFIMVLFIIYVLHHVVKSVCELVVKSE